MKKPIKRRALCQSEGGITICRDPRHHAEMQKSADRRARRQAAKEKREQEKLALLLLELRDDFSVLIQQADAILEKYARMKSLNLSDDLIKADISSLVAHSQTIQYFLTSSQRPEEIQNINRRVLEECAETVIRALLIHRKTRKSIERIKAK